MFLFNTVHHFQALCKYVLEVRPYECSIFVNYSKLKIRFAKRKGFELSNISFVRLCFLHRGNAVFPSNKRVWSGIMFKLSPQCENSLVPILRRMGLSFAVCQAQTDKGPRG